MPGVTQIVCYHAHIYYRDSGEKVVAAQLREALEQKFDVRMGRWCDEPVGPHPLPMFQAAFAPDQFPAIVPWLMLNRDGLTILVHPETGDDVPDHRDHAFWLGAKLDLDISFLEAGNTHA